MEALFGIVGKDYVLVAADRNAGRSIVNYSSSEDKILALDSHKVFAGCGPTGDRTQFSEYIQKNIHLYELRTGVPLTTHATAKYIRNQLAEALRSNPYNVNALIAGFDEKTGPHLFYMDYMASMHEMKMAAHGYAAYFGLSIMDRYYVPDMSLEEGKELLRKCIKELEVRFIVNLKDYMVKVVDKDGIRIIDLWDNASSSSSSSSSSETAKKSEASATASAQTAAAK